MKKNYYLLCLFLIIPLLSRGQVLDYKAGIDAYLLNLNKSQIPTGILYDRAYPLAGLHQFNKGGISDTSSYAHFKQAYFELYEANYNPVSMDSLGQLKKTVTQSLLANEVPIGIINYNFSLIDTTALSANLFSLQNNLLYDVLGRPRSPYNQHNTVVAAALTDQVAPGSVSFKLSNDFIKTNLTQTVTSVTVSFGNDNNTTAVIVPGNNLYTVTYSTAGYKTLKFIINFSNNTQVVTYATLYVTGTLAGSSCSNCATTVTILSPCNTNPEIIEATLPFQGYEETSATKGKAELDFYYANCSNPVLRKPIIVVDGFDPGDSRDGPTIFSEYLNSPTPFGQQLRTEGYDVVIVNWHTYKPTGSTDDRDGGADYIERNAFTLVEIIEEINRRLAKAGSNEKIVVIGPSMGGLITRYALAYMEKNNKNHNTRLWVSFDAPHLGANIPLGAQEYLKFYRKVSPGAGDNYNKKINSNAARQMLIHHNLANSVYPTGAPNFRQTFQTALDNIGYPVNLRKIALVNGSQNGVPQSAGTGCGIALHSVLDGTTVVRAGIKFFFLKFFPPLMFVNVHGSEAYVNFAPANNGTCTVFTGAGLGVLFSPEPITAQNPGYTRESLDLVQGGTFNTQQQIKEQGGFGWFASLFAKNKFYNVVPNHAFIPTASALGLTNNPARNWADNLSNIDLTPPCANETPFDAYYAPVQNEPHVYLSSAGATFVKNEINKIPTPPPAKNFNLFGKSHVCGTQQYSVSPNPGVPVYWSVTGDLEIVGSNTGTSVQIASTTANNNFGYGTITATTNNGTSCNLASTNSRDVSVGALTSDEFYISGPESVCSGEEVTFNINHSLFPYYTYLEWVWHIPSGWTYVSGQGTQSITLLAPNYGFYYNDIYAEAINDCGSSGSAASIYVEESGYCYLYSYSVSPNPANDYIEVKAKKKNKMGKEIELDNLDFEKLKDVEVKLYDNYSKELKTGKFKDGALRLDTRDLPNGFYIIHIINGNEIIKEKIIVGHQ